MPLPLPPKSLIRGDEQTARFVHEQLTSVIAGHPQATTTYRFYEELDTWLGPWGEQGYPMGYGKFYNIAFTSNRKLMSNPTTREWLWRTTILLQEALRDYVVGRVRNGSLPSLTEAELRQAAFESHPLAYTRAGLSNVVFVAPELLLLIASIPGKEFNPTEENFEATVVQVLRTVGIIGPQAIATVAVALAGPAHNGMLARAAQMDRRNLLNELAASRELGQLKRLIEQGAVDHIPLLDRIIARLNARQFHNQGEAQFAREVVSAAELRRQRLVRYYNDLLREHEDVRRRINRQFPRTLPSSTP